jgi:Tfp pilus assembly protein FimT
MPAKIEEATTSKKVSSEAKELTPKLRAARGVTVPTDIMPVPTLLHHVASNFLCSFRTSRTCQVPVLTSDLKKHDRACQMPVKYRVPAGGLSTD